MADKYPVIVTVEADSQADAFAFVEKAIEARLDDLPWLVGKPDPAPVQSVHVATPDGTKAVQF